MEILKNEEILETLFTWIVKGVVVYFVRMLALHDLENMKEISNSLLTSFFQNVLM